MLVTLKTEFPLSLLFEDGGSSDPSLFSGRSTPFNVQPACYQMDLADSVLYYGANG